MFEVNHSVAILIAGRTKSHEVIVDSIEKMIEEGVVKSPLFLHCTLNKTTVSNLRNALNNKSEEKGLRCHVINWKGTTELGLTDSLSMYTTVQHSPNTVLMVTSDKLTSVETLMIAKHLENNLTVWKYNGRRDNTKLSR